MNDTLTASKGFLTTGLVGGIKRSGNKDIGLIVCPAGATAAAMFTTNKVTAAAVQVCKEHFASSKKIDAVIVNAGNANCCTGKQGLKDAKEMCKLTADMIESSTDKILIASTGVIGHKMPMDKIKTAIPQAVEKLANTVEAGNDFANSILTTDTKVKQAIRTFKLGSKTITIAGTAKGAGMIGPNMATTLSFFTTDAKISKSLLQKCLSDAIGNSLNKLTVDGHQSTNDTAIILASGAAGNPAMKNNSPAFKKFNKALCNLCDELAKKMALDAEGATRIFTVKVSGAKNKADAQKAARAVADYDLVKCAIHGADPNWGRIICAVGSCGVDLNPEKLSCKINNITVFRNGQPAKFDAIKASEEISKTEHTISVNLGVGKAEDFCFGCDLSKDYVTINADYHT